MEPTSFTAPIRDVPQEMVLLRQDANKVIQAHQQEFVLNSTKATSIWTQQFRLDPRRIAAPETGSRVS